MSKTKVLNQQLYDRLADVFGDVKIHNEGQPFIASDSRRAFSIPGRRDSYVEIYDPGEYYAVCCPICGDTRHRLWINHCWNTGFRGHSLRHLVRCYNENCDEMEDFRETLDSLIQPDSVISIVRHAEAPVEDLPCGYPGTVVPLSSLSPDHAVIEYLRDSRGFDIGSLDRDWGVRWITESQHKLIFDHNRLVVPIYDPDDGLTMKGWQTRYFNTVSRSAVPPNKRTPKYITEGRVSTLLYNFHRVRQSKLMVICEGVFDAIRVGTQHGVCTFGKALSRRQIDLIENTFLVSGGRVVFSYDPDVSQKNWSRIAEKISTWPDVRYLNFPEGVDIADYSQADVNKLVEELRK